MSLPDTTITAPSEPEPAPQVLPRMALAATVATVLIAAAALTWDRPGMGWLLTGLAMTTALWLATRGERSGADTPRTWPRHVIAVRTGWTVAVGLLLAVGAVRAAGWLFALCVLTAGLVYCVALTDHRSIIGVLLSPVRVAGATPAAVRWLVRDGSRMRGRDRATVVRAIVTGIIAVALLVVFALLFAGADAAFAHVLSTMMPSFDTGTVLRWVVAAVIVVTLTAVAVRMLVTKAITPWGMPGLGLVRRAEWALPVGGLVVLFAGFVAVEATVLFGGDKLVQATTGLTYAEYARSGFWQLLGVTALTMIVVAVAARIAPRTTTTDRALLRTLLGSLSALTLVIVASALSRMVAYEQAYGFTRQRLLVTACELWLGVVFLLIIAAGARLRGRWLPQAALAAAVAALLGLAVLNPDRFIAQQNINRVSASPDRMDVNYLATLSADAVPALEALPDPYRTCVLTTIQRDLADEQPEGWLQWNLGRAAARNQLRDHPPVEVASLRCPPCPPWYDSRMARWPNACMNIT